MNILISEVVYEGLQAIGKIIWSWHKGPEVGVEHAACKGTEYVLYNRGRNWQQ